MPNELTKGLWGGGGVFIGWAAAYMVCVAITSATGSDIPFFVLMGVQLIKQSPDTLLQVRSPRCLSSGPLKNKALA